MEADIMKGFWAVPKRGMEVGGVLLGRVETNGDPVVIVDDYEAVPCEHRRGPSYVLSEPDRKRLEKVLRRATGSKQVVGFYRSHTRLGLYLDQDDMAVIDNYFAGPNHVFLLVRPDATKPGAAGFFIREEGDIHRQSTYLEFPFSRRELLKQSGAAIEQLEEPAPAPPPPPTRISLPRPVALPALPLRMPRVKWGLVGKIAAGLAAFAFLEYQVLTQTRSPEIVLVDFAPSLSVAPSGAYLQVSWNRNAPAVLKAERGILHITEGGFRKELNLDEQQLRTGAVIYAPRSNEVNFRLDLLKGRTTVTESLHFLSARKEPVEVAAAPPPEEPKKPSSVEVKTPPRQRVFFDDGL
ncbi:MAG TPA: hypothetical protein PKW45_08720 [Bryobacteraceae bacterium]|nr:hypothetical protein [Bryobacteraceae bacterium]HOQ46318.1 hypothetical protein [Bryobacteraceae bacterium]